MLDTIHRDLYNDRMSPERIRSIRMSLGWSKSELARRLQTSYMTVYNWERGKPAPTPVFRRMLDDLDQLRPVIE